MWRLSTGECSFYRFIEGQREVTVAVMGVAFCAAKGQGKDAALFLASWRARRARLHRKRWRGWLGRRRRPSRVRRKSSTVARATGHGGADNHVWQVAVVLVSVCARGEGEGRSAVTRRGDALACP